ncbi:hypothetical protein [Phytobacter sp. MRY16-398]|uniref:hypothetical protein n=1 Tax=Phytobacter sp. MRY16-398 TaxID=2487150 RepID=UPI000DF5F0B4|nr:hypothetical protein [Phytobacter sp. MRY16-398]BBE77405.1 hypothetical protein MRY16398_24610 [Phytobacter sp. MRY16-398]
MSELTVIEIKPEQAPTLYVPNGLDVYLEKIRELAKEVPDVTTQKGRDRIGSLARSVGSSKKAIEEPGRAYLKHLKELPKEVEAELRRFVTECDTIRDEILKPRVEWEKEQERIKQEEEARIAAEALTKQVEADHEIALLMDREFDRQREEARLKAEQEQREREETIRREAAEKATRDAEEKAQRERQQHQDALSEISGIQQQVIIAQSGRLGVRQGGTIQCIKETLAETEAWPIDERFGLLTGAAENAKQQAILQIKQLLVSAEEAARAADVEHRRTIKRRVISQLVEQGVQEEFAKAAMVAIASGKIQDAIIRY